MKRTTVLIAACLLMGRAAAQTPAERQEKATIEQALQPLKPTYLDNVFYGNTWKTEWFLSARGGLSAFIGKPVGHGDFFVREKPMLNITAGKWITPYVAARLAFQGLKFRDADGDDQLKFPTLRKSQ